MNDAGKKAWGYYPTTNTWILVQVDDEGKIVVDMSGISLGDLGDIDLTGIADGDILYWNDATSTWKVKAPYISPTTTAGDLIKRGAAADERLAIGANGQVLTVAAGAPAWSAAPGGTKIQDADGDTKVDVEESADEDTVRMDVAGVEAFLIHDDGIVDLAKQSACRYYLGTTQSMPSGLWSVVNLDTLVFDRQSEFNTVNHRFYPTKSGIYLAIGGAVFVAAQVVADVDYGIGIFRAITVQSQIYTHNPGATDLCMAIATIVELDATNPAHYLRLHVYQNSGVNKDLAAVPATYMAVFKIA